MKKSKLLIIALIALPCVSSASSYNSRVQRFYSPELVEAIIKEQIAKHPNSKPEARPLPCSDKSLAIDGCAPVIVISSQETTERLPSEYMELPTPKADLGKYDKNN